LAKARTIFIELVEFTVTVIVQRVKAELWCIFGLCTSDGATIAPLFERKFFWLTGLLSLVAAFFDVRFEEGAGLRLSWLCTVFSSVRLTHPLVIAEAMEELVVTLTTLAARAAVWIDGEVGDIIFTDMPGATTVDAQGIKASYEEEILYHSSKGHVTSCLGAIE
tara:strand:- start:2128 stop:2619 length:492 start_codon:yes stop_codon:yes gene_type:complete